MLEKILNYFGYYKLSLFQIEQEKERLAGLMNAQINSKIENYIRNLKREQCIYNSILDRYLILNNEEISFIYNNPRTYYSINYNFNGNGYKSESYIEDHNCNRRYPFIQGGE